MVDSAGIKGADTVFEIGTGSGVLTEMLAVRARKVITCEVDKQLIRNTSKRLSFLSNVEFIEGDSFKSPTSHIEFDVCVTSLPYSRSLDFLEWLASRAGEFRVTLAILQIDFVSKLMARSGAKNYRAVSVMAQISFEQERIGFVERNSFSPPPRVDSVITRFSPNQKIRLPFFNPRRIAALKEIFSFKGRLLRVALKKYGSKYDLHVSSKLLDQRIEKITPLIYQEVLERI